MEVGEMLQRVYKKGNHCNNHVKMTFEIFCLFPFSKFPDFWIFFFASSLKEEIKTLEFAICDSNKIMRI